MKKVFLIDKDSFTKKMKHNPNRRKILMHDATLVWQFPDSKPGKYRRSIIEIWHEDQGSIQDCKNWNKLSDRSHWTVHFIPWKRLTRKLFQRCAGCGGPSTRKNPVNHGYWDDRNYPFYYSKPDTYHETCMRKNSRQRKQFQNACRIDGYNRGYRDGRYELADGAGFHIPEDWKDELL